MLSVLAPTLHLIIHIFSAQLMFALAVPVSSIASMFLPEIVLLELVQQPLVNLHYLLTNAMIVPAFWSNNQLQ